MADSGTDRFLDSSGTEVGSNPSAVQFADGLDATLDASGIVQAKVKDSGISAAKIAANAVTFAKMLMGSEARTATVAGLTTGAITAPTAFRTFVAVTSGSAASQISLPAITAAGIGQELFLTVGANGYALITPALSNNTINAVDADGTNQLDVAANTTLRLTQVSATAWLAEQIANTAITVVAPDND